MEGVDEFSGGADTPTWTSTGMTWLTGPGRVLEHAREVAQAPIG